MVARTPPKEKVLMVAPHSLDATQIRQTLKKVDQCMARLQELQYTVNGGKKVVCGVNLSPRSTRAYMKTSLRCKQESIRMKTNSSSNVNGSRKSPVGKLPRAATGTAGGEWRRMSLPAMLVGETVGEILQASKFARDITETINKFSSVNNNLVSSSNEDPKTPLNLHKKQRDPRTPVKLHQRQIERKHNPENSTLESRRKREKQHKFRVIQPQSNHNNSNITPPSCRRRARSRINFKVSPPKKTQQHGKENRTSTILNAQGVNHQSTTASSSGRYSANRVSPKHKPWAKKTVLFPNPLFHSTSPTSSQQQNHKIFCNKTNSPIIGKKNKQQVQQTPHKFLIKSPPQKASLSKSPPRKERVSSSSTKFQVKIKTPPKISPPRPKFTAAPTERGRLAERGRNPSPSSRIMSTASRLRRSLSPARLANRLVSPLRSRKTNVQKSMGGDDEFMAGMKRRNSFMSMRFSTPRIIV